MNVAQVIRWAIRNSPAMNILMLTVLLVGAASMFLMRREMFPEFELEVILVTVPYPGASPAEVEDGICQKLEEAVRSIDGIQNQTSIAREGAGFLVLELNKDVPNVQKTLNEVRSEVDRIPSFPELAEDPEVKQITLRQTAIRVGVLGPPGQTAEAELSLRARNFVTFAQLNRAEPPLRQRVEVVGPACTRLSPNHCHESCGRAFLG